MNEICVEFEKKLELNLEMIMIHDLYGSWLTVILFFQGMLIFQKIYLKIVGVSQKEDLVRVFDLIYKYFILMVYVLFCFFFFYIENRCSMYVIDYLHHISLLLLLLLFVLF